MARHLPELNRKAYDMEVANERRECEQAVREVSHLIQQAQLELEGGRPPTFQVRTLLAAAGEAYQRAAAWAALDRVAFMLPGDETKEG